MSGSMSGPMSRPVSGPAGAPASGPASDSVNVAGSVAGEAPLLVVEDLTVAFGRGEEARAAVRGVSFELHAGETLALVGESGSGKSVTALSVLQLLNPARSRQGGSVRFRGQELLGAAKPVLKHVRGDRIGMIFQEPMTSLNPLHTVEKQINEVLLVHKGLDRRAARARTLELLSLVGLDNVGERLGAYPHQLSGGQRQRVMIAMALANEPDILIADEPTTALDVTVQAQILTLLGELQARLGLAVLLITHDLTVVRHVADRVAVMRDGEIRETGETARVFERPAHPYTRELLAAEPAGRAPLVDESVAPILEAHELKVWFPIRKGVLQRTVGHVKAVDGIDLVLRPGETLGVVGESGSGKSTLAQALLRLIPSEGRILFRGQAIDATTGADLKPLRRDMQVVFQDPFGSLSPRRTVAQIIMEGPIAHAVGGSDEENEARVVHALERVGLPGAARHLYPHEFSGGQRQRIALARALILEPALIVLDEPTSALDRAVQVQMIELLRVLQRDTALAYLFISHDLRVVRALANRVIVMQSRRGGRERRGGAGVRRAGAPVHARAADGRLHGADRLTVERVGRPNATSRPVEHARSRQPFRDRLAEPPLHRGDQLATGRRTCVSRTCCT